MAERARHLLQQGALASAPQLLGATLVSRRDGGEVAIRLTEVEAYEGADDPASHAFRGPTPRNSVMFGPAGRLYCYFVYGMHWCANVVCGPEGRASAVLLRAGEVIAGEDLVRSGVPATLARRALASGPARLARALGLDGSDTGRDLLDAGERVRLLLPGASPTSAVLSGPRVGVSSAQSRPWRFWLADEPSVSSYRLGGRRRASGASSGGLDRQT